MSHRTSLFFHFPDLNGLNLCLTKSIDPSGDNGNISSGDSQAAEAETLNKPGERGPCYISGVL